MIKRPSRTWLMFRMFCCVFIILTITKLFWDMLGYLAGAHGTILPFNIVFWVSVVLTVWFTCWGWIGVTVGAEVLLKNDPEFQDWKKKGGRPYWDGGLGWPINPATDIERQTGLAEPTYTDFTPPESWKYQCPICGSRVEKARDVCWNCNYGADGDNTAYHKRWPNG